MTVVVSKHVKTLGLVGGASSQRSFNSVGILEISSVYQANTVVFDESVKIECPFVLIIQ